MKFSSIIGQHKIISGLIRTVKENRISHAQLFLGPEGSGKFPLALAYARYINCRNRSATLNQQTGLWEGDSCGTCPSCLKYEKLAHPDLHMFYPYVSKKGDKPVERSADLLPVWKNFVFRNRGYFNLNEWYSEINVENRQGMIYKNDVYDILDNLTFKAYEAEYKVIIIWMIEKIQPQTAPKILKILEEPPPKTLFILISENHDQIISTILSRSQILKIPPIDDDSFRDAVSGLGITDQKEIKRLAVLSKGNFTAARHLIEKRDEDSEIFMMFRDWMRRCYSYYHNPKSRQKDIEEVYEINRSFAGKGREWQKSFFLFGLKVIRECTLTNYMSDRHRPSFEGEVKDFIIRFAPFINPKTTVRFSENLESSIYHIERNANPGILMTDLFLTFVKLFGESK